ncbi:MAG: nitroreductase family protein [Deltaproteobacteria bacterium]|jgi:hypothetical protein|nr:nitroreductase family protein [Deltaproteobacteria bacterium]
MKQKKVSFLVLVVCFLITASVALADIKLPAPTKDGGEGIFSLLEKRASGPRDNFPTGQISMEELSSLLWAATGLNRAGKGWTVPMAVGKPPYVKIYVVMPEGAFLYNWKDHLLAEVTNKNILEEITKDDFVKKSPCVLIFVPDAEVLGTMPMPGSENILAFALTGAMTQNIYLAADSLGISGRYMISMNADAIKSELKLGQAESPLCVMPLGKK